MSFLPAFYLGMVVAKYRVYDRWQAYWQDKSFAICGLKFVLHILFLIGIYKIYYFIPTDKFWDIKWGLFPVPVIFFIADYIAEVPGIKQFFAYFGKHSLNIFLVHTFIRYYYFEEFTYSMRHFVLVVVVLMCTSLVISIVIEQLKNILSQTFTKVQQKWATKYIYKANR